MNPSLIAAVVFGYLPGMLILLWGFTLLHKKVFIQAKAERAAKKRQKNPNLPDPLWPKWWERITFTLKDTRVAKLGKEQKEAGPTNKQVFFYIIGAGFLIAVASAFFKFWIGVAVGYLCFFIAVTWALRTAKDVIEARKKLLTRLYEVGVAKSLFKTEAGAPAGNYVKVLEWADILTPKKVEYQVQTSFNHSGSDSFLELFNQNFGQETAWVASTDKGGGWNYQEGKATLQSVPPLPQRAPWHERYIDNPAVAWSFFPIALGVENGLELKNEETGETEYVLGFDVSGEQDKVAQQNGVAMAPRITTSPMTLVAGGTGGGKALSCDTPVVVIEN